MDLPDFWSFNRSRDEHLISSEEITWEGPFRWPGTSGEEGPRGAGVYLLTFAYQDGYILRSAGVTNDMVRRMKEHRSGGTGGDGCPRRFGRRIRTRFGLGRKSR